MALNVKNFKKELKELLHKHNVSIGADIEGDTHGITENFVVLDNTNNKVSILRHYCGFIDEHDLK